MNSTPTKIGIVAGGGELPLEIARACLDAGRPVHVLAVDEFAADVPQHISHTRVSISKIGRSIRVLKDQGCIELVFVGHFARPKDRNIRIRPDFETILFLVRNLGVLRRSNDGIHRAFARAFEQKGFRIVSPLSAAPALAAGEGCISSTRPAPELQRQFEMAFRAALAHGATRQGQAIVFASGNVLASETRAGTDAMLRGIDNVQGQNAFLVKVMSPGQLATMDPPAIGSQTIALAAHMGLVGILVEAGRSIIVQPDKVREMADSKGLFVCGQRVIP
ncbi:MAG: UDP-2,3-diacylglucosamine diphosphatase LpxI [Micropepsaceae bacterium]